MLPRTRQAINLEDHWKGSSRPVVNYSSKPAVYEKEFEELGFEKFDDYWYFEDYAIKHKLRIIDNSSNNDCHLSEKNNYILADIIKNLFYSKIL